MTTADETRFVARYETIKAAIDERFDLIGSDLSQLIVHCIDNDGVISKRYRDLFGARVQEAIFAAIEDATQRSAYTTLR